MTQDILAVDAPSATMTASLLLQRLDPAESGQLLRDSLGHDMALLEKSFDTRGMSHAQACQCLVALNGLQILRNKEIRAAVVRSAHDDQVKACFSEFLKQQETIKTVDDFTLPHMRDVIASHAWQSGSSWSRLFCETLALPGWLSGREIDTDRYPYETVRPFVPLHELHDFQQDLRRKLEPIFTATKPLRALVALPTGAGKTRLLVETVLGLADIANGRRSVMWIAQHDELCEQAVQCFSQVWASAERPEERTLTIQRVWRSLNVMIDWTADVIVGTPESLTPRLKESPADDRGRILLAVIDEAHHALAPSYQLVFSLLSQSHIVGITATPGSAIASGAHRLRKRFGDNLLTSELLDPDPVAELQLRRILAVPEYETVQTNYRVGSDIIDTDAVARFGDLPPRTLEKLGKSTDRNQVILNRLSDIEPREGPVLCFASSVASSRALAAALTVRGRTARSVDAKSEPWNRAEAITDFRSGTLQFLINYGVLATGFDAPQVSVVVLARPTTSPILFEQMLGRGLRGPLNGGTESCRIIYFADDFTGFGGVRPLSYVRFLED